MSFKLLDNATAIGASLPIKLASKIQDFGVEVILNSSGTTKITAATVALQGGNTNTRSCVSTPAILADGSTAQRIGNSAFYYQLAGTNYTLALNAAGTIITELGGTAITAAITGSKFGGVVVVATSAAIRCLLPIGYAVDTTQAYDSAALCNAALDLVEIPSNACYVGKLIITAAGGGFTFGTTALTGVSTFYDAYCPYYNIETHALTADEITAQRAYFTVGSEQAKYIRTYLSALTGAGYITVKLYPVSR